MKSSGRTMALALALAPLGAVVARAQQASRTPARSHTQICVNGQCTDDSSRVVVLRLMDKVDSLKRIYLDRPMSPDQRQQMAEQMSDMIRQLTDLSLNAAAFGLQQAGEATRQAMSDATPGFYRMQVAPRMTSDAAPKGWIGLTFVGAPITDVRDGEYFVQFLDYPEVETVEPSSPAQRAGILHGDLLLSFNGQDVTSRAISMTRLLQPDHKIVVRMERDGQPHDYSMVVSKAPQSYMMRLDDFAAPRAEAAAGAGAATVVAIPSPAPTPAQPPRAVFFGRPLAPQPAVVGSWSSSFNFDSERAPIAGAEMSTLNPALARNLSLGVDHGVMVINAPANTPAAQSGLRNADVIVKVAGDDIASVRDLRRALQRHDADTVIELQIIRDKHQQTLKIRND